MNTKQQKQKILDLIDDLFGDTSVSQRTTLAAMQEIKEACESNIQAIEDDIKSGRGS